MQTIGELFALGCVRGGVLPKMHYSGGRFVGFNS